ncbi:prolyl endopeptidase-like isoform X2 [Spea bombifrons]|uniref:prolyl endopeptidase-like isoform X2 n=1 Tax=Spea bombifrons TaxID=233779 RepID=UPI00234A4D41|nr:prolyl endopeptidase-like isoform X2 [Spea bombifrons]
MTHSKTMSQVLFTYRRSSDIKHKSSKYPRHGLLRGFSSWQVLLDWERKHWQTVSVKYRDLADMLEKRLNVMHTNYPCRTETEMVRQGDYMYFEDNGCICRFQPKIGEESLEVLLCSDDIGLSDHIVQRIRISPKQNFLAVKFKSSEREESTCIIVKLGSVPEVVHCIQNMHSFEWVTESILFYTQQENLCCHHVFLTEYGDKYTSKLVYSEQDPRYFVDIYCTRDKRFLTINSNSKSTSEVWLVRCSHPLEDPVLVQKRVPGMIYHVEHRQGSLYLLTTHGESAEYKLMKAPLFCDMGHWKPVYEVKSKVKLVDMEMLKDHCMMVLKDHGHLRLDVISLTSEKVVHSVELPAWACAFEPGPHPQYEAENLSFYLSSPIQQAVLFNYSLSENRLAVEASYKDVNVEGYRTERIEAQSKDGTRVPVTVLYKGSSGDLKQRPLLIHVYGAYGMDLDMSFKAEKRLLVDDGWILAYCHVRGGGEKGHNWHKEGILDKKQNGVDDLRACVVHLHEQGFSQSNRTALEASSAGGVLAGALHNSAPGLFKTMVLEAPFLDVLNTMMDTTLPLTVEEQEEWGDPVSNSKHHQCIKMYCPYQNIRPQNYPSVLITVYENDQRVPLKGLLRYSKKLRNAADNYCHNAISPASAMPSILLDIQAGGSHCDSLSWQDSLQKVAMHLAFLYRELQLA